MAASKRKLPMGLVAIALAVAAAIIGNAAPFQELGGSPPTAARRNLPDKSFRHPPRKAHDPSAFYYTFDQLEHHYRVPGEFTHRLTGDEYGFDSLSFIITETHPSGGPGLHSHDTEEAHILLNGTAQYRIGDTTFTVQAPYVARVPAGIAHTFVNAGSKPFNLVAVFASRHPETTRIGPNPLIDAPPDHKDPHGSVP